jgi:hypothetical protein
MRLLIVIIIFMISICHALADTHEVTTCSVANVQAAVNAATAGDTVFLNCAGGTWTSTVQITKGITIRGNGENSTTITANNATLFNIALSSGSDFRITDLGFMGSVGGSLGALIVLRGGGNYLNSPSSTIWNSLRADHLKFSNTGAGHAFVIDPWYEIPSHPKALFDHITLTSNNGTNFIKIAGNNITWRSADLYGTDWAIYIEDSTFTWGNTTHGYITDTEHGARVVVRHNTIINGTIQMHSTDSTVAARGNRIFEIYGNTIDCTSSDCSNLPAIGVRGGGFVVYNNTITGNFWTGGYHLNQRSAGEEWLGKCDGTPNRYCNTNTYHQCSGGDHPACAYVGDSACAAAGKGTCVKGCSSNSDCGTGTDGTATCLETIDNVDGSSGGIGYPCRDQTGWGQEYGTGGRYQYPSPVYWYNNGTTSTCASGGACNNSATIAGTSSWFVQNRDFCYHSPASDCGTKVAWTYTPYTYPHPLQAGTYLQSPNRLRLVQ